MGRRVGSHRGHNAEEQESENDSGPPDFGKEPALLLHLISAAADLGLIVLRLLPPPSVCTQRREKSQIFHCKFITVTDMRQTWIVSPFVGLFLSYYLLQGFTVPIHF